MLYDYDIAQLDLAHMDSINSFSQDVAPYYEYLCIFCKYSYIQLKLKCFYNFFFAITKLLS